MAAGFHQRLRSLFGVLLSLGVPHSAFTASESPLDIRPAQSPRLYRGMTESQAPISAVLELLALPDLPNGIPSHRLSTLKRLHPDWTPTELRDAIDQDLLFFRSEPEALPWIAACHSSMLDCDPPSVQFMMGASFREPIDPIPAGETHTSFGNYPENTFRFKPYDPVISTSVSHFVALTFVRGEQGYLVEVNDRRGRNCPTKSQSENPELCRILETEYPDEEEYPFYGYISGSEITAVEQGKFRITRGQHPGYLRLEELKSWDDAETLLYERIQKETDDARALREAWDNLPECHEENSPTPAACKEVLITREPLERTQAVLE